MTDDTIKEVRTAFVIDASRHMPYPQAVGDYSMAMEYVNRVMGWDNTWVASLVQELVVANLIPGPLALQAWI